ncbi:hypothetical protein [Clostridium estertheticum]|uniref:hypothetical protein n=1 Tax=Clostridium estertheticum TaxID=238834 RepID=UPI001877D106|nr:hypothetical protein [Clostridium estertheticum]
MLLIKQNKLVKMVELGLGTQSEIEDIILSRYACYLIAQNADTRKKYCFRANIFCLLILIL